MYEVWELRLLDLGMCIGQLLERSTIQCLKLPVTFFNLTLHFSHVLTVELVVFLLHSFFGGRNGWIKQIIDICLREKGVFYDFSLN